MMRQSRDTCAITHTPYRLSRLNHSEPKLPLERIRLLFRQARPHARAVGMHRLRRLQLLLRRLCLHELLRGRLRPRVCGRTRSRARGRVAVAVKVAREARERCLQLLGELGHFIRGRPAHLGRTVPHQLP